MTTAYMPAAVDSKPPLSFDLQFRLSIMMFLQYAIWGAWLPLLFPFFNEYRGLSGTTIAYIIGVGAVGALVAPFIAGQIADRYFNTERFLAVAHLLGAIVIWVMARSPDVKSLAILSFIYAMLYTPTMALTNALAFHHLPDRDRDFGKVRVMGTIGWIAVGIGMGQYLLYKAGHNRALQVEGMGDAFRLSAILGVCMAFYCLFLPKTPPARRRERSQGRYEDDTVAHTTQKKFAPGEALAEIARNRSLLWIFLVSFPIACIHQFYFVRTSQFLGTSALGLNNSTTMIDKIFGVGGGGLMTIGQMSELIVLALMPFIAKSVPRKLLLCLGLLAYVVRFAVFAYLPYPAAVLPALALHGICFGFFFFMAFMIVDELCTKDVRGSAQNLYNLIIVGFGVLVGNFLVGWVDNWSIQNKVVNYRTLFSIPMWIAIVCFVLFVLVYPNRSQRREEIEMAEVAPV